MNTSIDWMFLTEPEKNIRDSRVYTPRGKVIGGSSSVNANLYIRGHPVDYNSWNQIVRDNETDKSWSYEEMLRYFRKSEHHLDSNVNTKYHGKDGKWKVRSIKPVLDSVSEIVNFNLTRVAIETISKSLDIPIRDDPNELTDEEEKLIANGKINHILQSVSYHHHSIDENGRRHSLAEAFLDKETLERPNLHVRTSSLVRRILFNDKKVATGVEYINQVNNQVITVQARKGVILSAGAISSPQILMLSGIGKREKLERLNITVVADLPGVGQSLHDHVLSGIVAKLRKGYTSLHSFESIFNLLQWITGKSFSFLDSSIARYLLPYAVPESWRLFTVAAPHIQGYFKSSVAERNNDPVDIQIVGVPGFFVHHGSVDYPNENGVSLGVVHLQPKSRGSVELVSADIHDHPKIIGNFLADKDDAEAMTSGVKKLLKVFSEKPLSDMVDQDAFLFCDPRKHLTDQQILECSKTMTSTLYHPTSTCKMGKNGEPMAVVDSSLRVFGVHNLRVVDASVMPSVPRGNTNAPTAAIAEKAADLIIQQDQ